MTQKPNSKFYQTCERMILLSHQRQPARKQKYGFYELKLITLTDEVISWTWPRCTHSPSLDYELCPEIGFQWLPIVFLTIKPIITSSHCMSSLQGHLQDSLRHRGVQIGAGSWQDSRKTPRCRGHKFPQPGWWTLLWLSRSPLLWTRFQPKNNQSMQLSSQTYGDKESKTTCPLIQAAKVQPTAWMFA